MSELSGYISVRDASYKWKVSARRINTYCQEGRIDGLLRVEEAGRFPAMQKSLLTHEKTNGG